MQASLLTQTRGISLSTFVAPQLLSRSLSTLPSHSAVSPSRRPHTPLSPLSASPRPVSLTRRAVALFPLASSSCLPSFSRRFSTSTGLTWHPSSTASTTSSSSSLSSPFAHQRRSCYTQCWKCTQPAAPAELFFCAACGVIQSPCTQISHFQLLSCPQKFSLDAGQLEKNFRRLQFRLHPDRFSLKSEPEREYSALQSSHVNRAYDVLRNPMRRGEYLLQLHGMTQDAQLPQDFLVDMMELNEALEDAQTADLPALHTRIKAGLQECESKAAAAFDQSQLSDAHQALARMKYFDNLERAVRERLAGGKSTA